MTNTTDYRTMEAGRELDTYIAQLQGWKLIREVSEDGRPFYFWTNGEGFSVWNTTDTDSIEAASKHIPHYSTDLNVAITLVMPNGVGKININNWQSGVWTVHYLDSIQGDKSLPLAICRAWLAWKDSQTNAS